MRARILGCAQPLDLVFLHQREACCQAQRELGVVLLPWVLLPALLLPALLPSALPAEMGPRSPGSQILALTTSPVLCLLKEKRTCFRAFAAMGSIFRGQGKGAWLGLPWAC